MNKNDIAIASICWARDAGEEKLLREALTTLAAYEIPIFITDGGSDSGFLHFLQTFPHFTVLQAKAKGVWAQARKSIEAAYESKSEFILYTEPDKLNFFRGPLSQFIAEAPGHDQIGVVLASRSVAGYATFPEFQQTTETAINQCCAEVTGLAVDFTYGPFLFRRDLAPYLRLVQEDIGWGWRPYIFGLANRLGYQLMPHIANYMCPEDQQEDSKPERIYRMKQLTQNIQGLVLSTIVPIK